MRKGIALGPELTIGIDLGDKNCVGCVVGAAGEEVETFRARTTDSALSKQLSRYPPCRVVIEVGTHSPWISRLIQRLGHEVIVANPRRVRLIAVNDSKSDEVDAELLARLGRIDPNLLCPIEHRGEAAQRDLLLLRSRDGLVRARSLLINQARGFAKSLGERLPSSSTAAFAKRMRAEELSDLFPGFETMLGVIQHLSDDILKMKKAIEKLCSERYPETKRLRQIKGVGPITSLTFILTLEDPTRFAKSRSVGAYLGLRPRQRSSGQRNPQLRITKAGDGTLRRLLVQAAQYVLGPFGPDCDLRRQGERLAERGGKAAKKRAVVAVARKLAVLLHRLWVTGEPCQPLGYQPLAQAA
jgi:transposase